MNDRERAYAVYLTNGETVEPNICKTKDNGWLYCCWADADSESVQRKYPPHAVKFYESRPAGTDGGREGRR